ncbi:MAG: 3-dehydroquinate synthase [Pseudoalteromonas tetraodonis]|jgi:3-dehydroquinate synthase
MQPITVPVDLADRGYQIHIGQQLFAQCGSLIANGLPKFGRRTTILTDSNVGPLYAETVATSLRQAGFSPDIVTVPAGELSKSMTCVEDVCRQMMRLGHDRGSSLIALGGGVVGDLGGFVAAIFFRGIAYVQLPTTIVSQVDSSVGGKTGVNAPEGKNLIGAFHQPQMVIADIDALQSLPDREYNEGFAEVIKHAAIRDANLLDTVAALEGRQANQLAPMIQRNVEIKARVVVEDERETSGVRALLNFGHTIGHAIESTAGYGKLLHGEAISLGLAAALDLGVRKFGLAQADADRVIAALEKFNLPLKLEHDISDEIILEALARDKKFEAGNIRFVIVEKLGEAFVTDEVTIDDIKLALANLRA